MDSGLLVIGHRGASADAPENTHAAFALALDCSADGIEFDVRLARDGVPVVIHDATLKRTGLRDVRVDAFTSDELARVDVGTWFNRRFPAAALDAYAREGVPTLETTLELVGLRARVIYIELKCEHAKEHASLAAAVVRIVRERGLTGSVVVKSFTHAAIAEVKRLAPDIRTAALFERKFTRPVITARRIITQAVACGADEISLHYTLLNRAVVSAASERGMKTMVWTVDAPSWLARARKYELRAVITNRPAALRAALDALRRQDASG
ncbi:MAG: glycerophosphodiester phosphodiesterase family protein [Pyrinomonadaceae bacterium]